MVLRGGAVLARRGGAVFVRRQGIRETEGEQGKEMQPNGYTAFLSTAKK